MNNETKDSISRALDIIREHLTAIDTNKASVDIERASAAEMEKRRFNIEATGQGKDGLVSLMAEIGQQNEHINRLMTTYQELCMALNNDLEPIYSLAHAVLNEIYEQKLVTAIAQIRPHVATDRDAQREAGNTVECRAVRQANAKLGAGPWDSAESHARIIVRYFAAAIQET